jgi:hypothetical protein
MADAPTAESGARLILKTYLKFNMKTGGVLRPSNFHAPFEALGLGANDFESAVIHALQQRWVERDTPYSYRLTATGFAQAE